MTTTSHPLVLAGQRPVCDVAAAERSCIPQPQQTLDDEIDRLGKKHLDFQKRETLYNRLAVASIVLIGLHKIVGWSSYTWLRTAVIVALAATVLFGKAYLDGTSAQEVQKDQSLLQNIHNALREPDVDAIDQLKAELQKKTVLHADSDVQYKGEDVNSLLAHSVYWEYESQAFKDAERLDGVALLELEAASASQQPNLVNTKTRLAASFNKKYEALCAKVRAAFYRAVLMKPASDSVLSFPRSSDELFSFKKIPSCYHIWNANNLQELRAAVEKRMDDELVHSNVEDVPLTWDDVQRNTPQELDAKITEMIALMWKRS